MHLCLVRAGSVLYPAVAFAYLALRAKRQRLDKLERSHFGIALSRDLVACVPAGCSVKADVNVGQHYCSTRRKRRRSDVATGIQLAVGPQPLWLRNHNSGPAQRIMLKRLATSPHDPIDSIGYPCMSASGESSTTMHRLLHASGSHPIPPPNDPKLLFTVAFLRQFPSFPAVVWRVRGCEGERQYRILISLLGSLATMRRVVNYHSSRARQRQVELFDASGNPGFTAHRGYNPAGGSPGGG
ncbi:hypothetical protein F511_03879 [Dorcoceras hygrometricum]|uniref:Uncharacterized protein n=1 Tax=Dorcoceras hygrometricum TaxID=472368 RepID=A0A2Z7AX90_9LAMI|nr:hypothetical protein F511_03879 [Dorcoceras hygrometricum]